MMILFNTTFVVGQTVEEEFRSWLNERFIPAALQGGLSQPLLTRILQPAGADGQPTDSQSYALQFKAPSVGDVDRWLDAEGANLIGEMQRRHGENLLCFSTYMEIL